MAEISLDTIIRTSLLFAFILPAFAMIGSTLPPPSYVGTAYNFTSQFNNTATYIASQFSGTYNSTAKTLVGSGTNTSGASFYVNPSQFQAFAFIVSGLGTVMTDLVQLPYLDYLSFQMIDTGFASMMPKGTLSFVTLPLKLLYYYLLLSIILAGFSAIMKYNIKSG